MGLGLEIIIAAQHLHPGTPFNKIISILTFECYYNHVNQKF